MNLTEDNAPICKVVVYPVNICLFPANVENFTAESELNTRIQKKMIH